MLRSGLLCDTCTVDSEQLSLQQELRSIASAHTLKFAFVSQAKGMSMAESQAVIDAGIAAWLAHISTQ